MSTSGRVVKKEIVTTTQPDGTLLRTTTKTVEEGGEDYYAWECGAGSVNADYCCTPIAFIRILQILFGFIIVGCVSGVYGTSYAGALSGQHFVLILACLCICITFVLLVIFILNMHNTVLSVMPWRHIDLLYSLTAAFLFLIAGILESYYASGAWGGDCQRTWDGGREREICPAYTPWIFAAIFCFLNAILYGIGAFFAWKKKWYL